MALFAGTPLYNVYLRLLGAKIGRDAVIHSTLVPVCTDLISIGDNTILRQGLVVLRLQGAVRTASRPARSPSATTPSSARQPCSTSTPSMEDDTQLGHASSLQSGQRVPRGKHYHGSPGQETTADYCTVARRRTCTPLRRCALLGLSAADRIRRRAAGRRSCWCITRSRCSIDYTSAPAASTTPACRRCSRSRSRCWRCPWRSSLGAARRSGCSASIVVPRLLQPVPARGQDLRRSTACATIISQTVSARQQFRRLQPAVRRQLVHRPLSAAGSSAIA